MMMFENITLSGAQTKVYKLRDDVSVQIKGVAGSGKSTVALYRLAHMVKHALSQGSLFDAPSVVRPIMFTFNRLLCDYLQKAFAYQFSGQQSDVQFEFVNFHKWAYDFMESRGKRFPSTNKSPKTMMFGLLKRDRRLADKQIADWDYIVEEVSWIKGKAIENLDEYLRIARTGRSRGLQKHHREAVWMLYKAYEAQLDKWNQVDFNDYALECLDELARSPLTESEQYTHVIVDEAQDLTKAQLKVITQLLGEKSNSITIIADAAQQIYNSGFTWADVGIKFAPQNVVDLIGNYRNSRQIGELALQIQSQLSDKTELSEFQLAARKGDKPELIIAPPEELIARSVKVIKDAQAHNAGTTCVMMREKNAVREFTGAARRSGLEATNITDSREIPTSDVEVMVTTMTSAKGLEFDNVIIVNIVDGVIPSRLMGDGDDPDFYDKELKLLFTAVTRAKNKLTIINPEMPSLFLDSVSDEYLQEITSA